MLEHLGASCMTLCLIVSSRSSFSSGSMTFLFLYSCFHIIASSWWNVGCSLVTDSFHFEKNRFTFSSFPDSNFNRWCREPKLFSTYVAFDLCFSYFKMEYRLSNFMSVHLPSCLNSILFSCNLQTLIIYKDKPLRIYVWLYLKFDLVINLWNQDFTSHGISKLN